MKKGQIKERLPVSSITYDMEMRCVQILKKLSGPQQAL